jgi:uncharacterized lipoprotein YmbA
MSGWLTVHRSGALLIACALLLAGCQSAGDSTLSLSGIGGARVDAPGVPIALESIDGAPDALKVEFTSALVSEASARRVEVVPSEGQARYRLRGYLTAYQSDDGRAMLAFVWDVFDAGKRRMRRLEGAMPAGRAGPDPWSTIGTAQLQQAASQSMNEIASFLAGNPGAGS